jgi:CDP-6-deoxy-D-xylo-4-hexulose-3-dehydrase
MMLNKADYPRVPYGLSVHGEDEIAAVVDVLRASTQMGSCVRKMEREVSELFGQKHGIMVNSGSSALMLALELLDLPEGSEVITPALTFATTVSYIIRNKLVPAYVDVAESTYVIDPGRIEEMISPKTRAIVAPHLIGNIVDWRLLQPLIEKYDLKIVEDSADTLGATLDGNPTGIDADISTTSFYGSHVINCAGNGGMLCVTSEAFDKRARLLRSWGRSSSLNLDSEAIESRFNVELDGIPYDAKFVFDEIGHNVEPSELGAAFGLIQLKNLERNISCRIDAFDRQAAFFMQFEDWFALPRQTVGSRTGWLAFPLTIRNEAPFSRRELQIFLEKRNIQTRVVFTGNITRQPGFKDTPMRKADTGYAEADKVMRGGIMLACHHGLTEEMIAHVHQSFTEFAGRY